MNMLCALIPVLEQEYADGNLPPDQAAKLLEEIHRLRKRVVRPRDTSKDNEPIHVGTRYDRRTKRHIKPITVGVEL